MLASTAAVWLVGFGALRLSLLAPEACPTGTEAPVAAAAAAGEWIAEGQRSDGSYLYEYDRAEQAAMPGYNIVRHAGVTMSLYQLADAQADAGDDAGADAGADAPTDDDPTAGRATLAVADEGLDYMLDRLVPAGGGQAFVEPGASTARLGASALMAAALEARRDATDDPAHDRELRALGRFLAGQIGPNGQGLEEFDLEASAVVADETSRYATGEAGWALARLHTLFPGEGWDEPARRVATYLATERDEAEGLDFFPPWPDQWAAYLLAELAPAGLDEVQAGYARGLGERFGMLIRAESQKDSRPHVVVDPRARAAGLGVWVEGLASISRVAEVDDRLADLRSALADRLRCGAGILADRQVTAAEAAAAAQPERVRGAWFRDDVTRMDDQQHALTALLASDGRLERSGT
jgi:hypothetical protein